MKSIMSLLLSVKNLNTKRILYRMFKQREMLSDNVGIYYNLDNYRIVCIF